MKLLALPAFALLLILSSDLIGSEEDDIKAAFEKYKAAIIADDGKTAAAHVDEETIQWYAKAASDALTVDKATLQRRSFIEKLTILRMRLEFTKDELSKMTGKDIVRISIEKGWTGKDQVGSIALERVVIEKDSAKAFAKGEPRFPAFHFKKESARWKLALTKMFPMANAMFRQQVKQSGMEEDEMILETLKALSNNKVDESLFNVPK